MKNNPVNYVKVEVYDLAGVKVYTNDLWLCVSGKKRHLLKAQEVYDYYKSRFDIEHFFKFAKSKIRFDKLQTTNPQIDEDYCMCVMLSYNHLYHLKDYANVDTGHDWYSKSSKDKTPSTIYRSLSEVRHNFHDIVKPAIARGIPDERSARKLFVKQANCPVIKKTTPQNNIEISIKVPFGKGKKFTKTTFNANDFDEKTLIAKFSALHKKITANTEPNLVQ